MNKNYITIIPIVTGMSGKPGAKHHLCNMTVTSVKHIPGLDLFPQGGGRVETIGLLGNQRMNSEKLVQNMVRTIPNLMWQQTSPNILL